MGNFYYNIAPGDKSYRSSDLLTYESTVYLKPGHIVFLEVRRKKQMGIVISKASKPGFKTKNLTPSDILLPNTILKLFHWLNGYYPRSVGPIANLLLPTKILSDGNQGLKSVVKKANAFQLTDDQKKAIQSVKMGSKKTLIFHGETGSGKTQSYIEITKKALDLQKSALILIPEISLSPQISTIFEKTFGQNVIVNHSGLTPKQRNLVWQRVLNSKEPLVVIGPRSSLFLPFSKLGLVVVDEFHEGAYKQESSPHYNGLRVAAALSDIHSCPLIFGSATPPVNEYFWAEQKNIQIIKMNKIANSIKGAVDSEVVDLSSSEEKTSYPLISNTLLMNIKKSMAKGEQVLLFLNKRGSSRALVCQSCGWRSTCDKCDLPFTYHGDIHKLICHTCGSSQTVPSSCPRCKSTDIIFRSPGTKAIVETMQKLFPDKNIARFDRDNKKSENLDARYEEVVSGKIDILIGTQMLVKGHDLPKLGLVGIIQAESSLNFPDFSSNEKSYQLIHQVSGRVGRGHRAGKIVVQSFTPDNKTIKQATSTNWNSFYEDEIAHRKIFKFPPFYHLLKIEVSRAKPTSAQQALEKIANELKKQKDLIVVGPSPSFIEKRANKYYWQIVVKSKKRTVLTDAIYHLPSDATINLDPTQLL